MNGAGHQAIALHLPQGLGEHLLTDFSYEFAEAGKTNGSMFFENPR